MGFFGNIGKFLSKSFKSLSNPAKYLGDLGNALLPHNWFSDFDGDMGLFGNVSGNIQDFWKDYTGQTVAEKNLKFQREQFDYQKMLNAQQMQREDTAYQRKVADMTKAGFNPILATGGAGSPSAPLHAGNAPQLPDYSGGVRQGVGTIADAVFKAISMRKDFAKMDSEIQLLRSQRDNVLADTSLKDAQTVKLQSENKYSDEYHRLINQGLELENAYKDGTLDSRIKLVSQELSMNDKKLVIMDLEKVIKEYDVEGHRLDNVYKELTNEGKLTENELLSKKLELLTQEVLTASFKLDTLKKDTKWYHDRNLPSGFSAGMVGNLGLLFGALGESGVNHVINFFGRLFGNSNTSSSVESVGGYTAKEWKVAIKEATKRPMGSNILWTQNMHRKGDYGVRRNF